MSKIKEIEYYENEPSNVGKLRALWLKKGFDLINITELCEFKLGHSGWINSFNEPTEEAYHIQVYYRDESIGVISPKKSYVIEDEEHLLFIENENDILGPDFIIFRKVPLTSSKRDSKGQSSK